MSWADELVAAYEKKYAVMRAALGWHRRGCPDPFRDDLLWRSVEANLRLRELLARTDAGERVGAAHACRIAALDDQIAAMCAEAEQYRPALRRALAALLAALKYRVPFADH